MSKKNVLHSVILAVLLILSGCFNPSVGTPNPPTGNLDPVGGAGKFMAVPITAGPTSRNATIGSYSVQSSKSVYFILRNIGTGTITNITLTAGNFGGDSASFAPSSGKSFVLSPGSLNSLEPVDTSSIETLVEVDINHGQVIGEIGQNSILAPSILGTTIRILGSTVDSANTAVPVDLYVDLGTVVKVADFSINSSSNSGATFTPTTTYDFLPSNSSYIAFLVPSGSIGNVKVKNTGNVDWKIKVRRNWPSSGGWENANSWETVSPGSYSLALTDMSGSSPTQYFFLVDTGGVVFDSSSNADLSFRPGTSIVQSATNASNSQPIMIGVQ